MATTLYARTNAGQESDVSTGTNTAKENGSTSGWFPMGLSTSRGSAYLTYATSTVTGPTNGIEIVSSSTPLEFISPPLAADVTISGSITFNIHGLESSMSANVALNCRLSVINGVTGAITSIIKTVRTTELDTSNGAQNWSATPTSTACKRGDRLRLTIFGDDAGTMATGYTFTVYVSSSSGGSIGDSYLTLTETLTFEANPTTTTVYLTDTASDVATAAVDRAAWTSRGGGVANDVTNTAAGWTSPIQVTDTAGGTVADWWTPQLSAFTLGGAVKVNLKLMASDGPSAFASGRVEIAVCNSDGTNPATWGVATCRVAMTAGEAAFIWLVGGDDVSVTNGQRLRIRVMIDDYSINPMASGGTVTFYYAGTGVGGTGDSYLIFGQTLTEYVSGPVRVPYRSHMPQMLAH